MAVNWNLAHQVQPNDYLGPLQALALGQKSRMDQIAAQREQQQAQARQTAAQQAATGDMAGATQTAYAAGDFDLAKSIAGMQDGQRKALGEVYDTIGQAANVLKRLPPEQRPQAYASLAPILKARGVPDDVLAQVSFDDVALDGYIATAGEVGSALTNFWEANNGDRMAMGPDGRPVTVYRDPTPRMDFIADGRGGGRWVSRPGTGDIPPEAPASDIPEAAMVRLRENPDRAADFDAMFGAGAADRVLGGAAPKATAPFP